MKKTLFLCNTYMQLIIAVQMKYTIMKNDFVAVLISDHSQNAKEVAIRLKKENFFERVEYIETNNLDNDKHGAKTAIKNILDGVYGKIPQQEKVLGKVIYDQFLFYNLNISTVTIFAFLYKKNHSLICSRFEEGINSYKDFPESLSARMRGIYKIRKILGKKNLCECVKTFYCFHPDYYMGNCIPLKIPLINNRESKIKPVLNSAFGVDVEKIEYNQKYIYFAGVGDFREETAIGEVKLAKKIADFVGNENLLVKVHPRDKTGAFITAGLNIDRHSTIPWEIIQMNYNFKDHIFLTACSGSVLTMNAMISEVPNIFFLYPMCNILNNKDVQKAVAALEKLIAMMQNNLTSRIHIIGDLKEMEKVQADKLKR